MSDIKKPELATDDALEYLDNLRESGVCNMLGACEYLAPYLGVSQREAKPVLLYWMKTFGQEDR